MRVALILAAFVLFGCEKKEEAKPPAEEYSGQGRVVDLNPEPDMVMIKHSEIPKFMPAMVMMFHVQNQDFLNNLHEKDSIQFTLTKTDSGFVITKIEVVR